MSIAERLRSLFKRSSKGAAAPMPPEEIGCEEALAALYEYLDGELTGVQRERVREHFDACARCLPSLRREEAFRRTLRRAVRGQKAPPKLRDSLLEAIARARVVKEGDSGRAR